MVQPGLSNEAMKSKQQQLRIRVCNVLKQWLQTAPQGEFDKDSPLTRDITVFLKCNLRTPRMSFVTIQLTCSAVLCGMELTSSNLLAILEARLRGPLPPAAPIPSGRILGDNFDPRSIHPLELARQLTIVGTARCFLTAGASHAFSFGRIRALCRYQASRAAEASLGGPG
jgi:hypothetical protein